MQLKSLDDLFGVDSYLPVKDGVHYLFDSSSIMRLSHFPGTLEAVCEDDSLKLHCHHLAQLYRCLFVREDMLFTPTTILSYDTMIACWQNAIKHIDTYESILRSGRVLDWKKAKIAACTQRKHMINRGIKKLKAIQNGLHTWPLFPLNPAYIDGLRLQAKEKLVCFSDNITAADHCARDVACLRHYLGNHKGDAVCVLGGSVSQYLLEQYLQRKSRTNVRIVTLTPNIVDSLSALSRESYKTAVSVE